MKKLLVILAFLILPATSYASSFTLSGSTITAIEMTSSGDLIDPANSYCVFQNNVSLGCSSMTDFPPNPQTQNLVTDWGADTNEALPIDVDIIVDATGAGDCGTGATLSSCNFSDGFLLHTHFTPSSPTPPVTGVAGLIATASSTFMTDLGFNWINVTDLMKNMMSLVMGSGLGILKLMLPLVLVLVIITAIVYFIYRAFRFFRH